MWGTAGARVGQMLEFLKTLGSFLGLLTSVVFFYDRIAKGRPIASLTIVEGTKPKKVCIRINNPSSYDIAILDGTVSPPVYFLVPDLEVRTVLEGASGERPYFMLKPGESKELILAPHFRNNIPLEVDPQRITVKISWRRGNATWLPQVPVFVRTSTETIRKYGLEKYT